MFLAGVVLGHQRTAEQDLGALGMQLPQVGQDQRVRLYSQQLSEGDDYTRLRPTISICFVNGTLFAGRPEHHTLFRLLDGTGQLWLTDDLTVHGIELLSCRSFFPPRSATRGSIDAKFRSDKMLGSASWPGFAGFGIR
jgi:hypothetical protein